ncbi:MAG: hypothetical protein JW912_08000, partial [Sedimentisphaerales bacterium]|nr:hypothetical protein [Sedimentisphaerales bacterium]
MKSLGIIEKLPGKNCGLCGVKSCSEFAELVASDNAAMERCIFMGEKKTCSISEEFKEEDITWKDSLDREYDFVLDKFPGETGPRETIILFNPTNVEKLKIKKGDILYGRPAWISCGCPVTHVGVVVEEPDYFNGTVVWCIVGPMLSRDGGIDIGYYNTTAYEGLVKHKKVELQIGKRHYFQPRYCMLQWR